MQQCSQISTYNFGVIFVTSREIILIFVTNVTTLNLHGHIKNVYIARENNDSYFIWLSTPRNSSLW